MENSSPRVFAIILNYCGSSDTKDCLASLLACGYDNLHVMVVDNNSPDDSLRDIFRYLKRSLHCFSIDEQDLEKIRLGGVLESGRVSIVQTGRNGGYGFGNNVGMKLAVSRGADYILVLNNDTVVSPDFLAPLVSLCEENPNIGLASSKVYFYSEKSKIWFHGGTYRPCSGRVVHFHFGEVDSGQAIREPITFLSGCVWLVPRRTIEEIGLIEEAYFMYVEDLEYCQRVLRGGFELAVSCDSKVWHKVSMSSGGGASSFSVFFSAQNLLIYILNNSFGLCRLVGVLNLVGIDIIRYVYRRRIDLVFPHLKGVWSGLKKYVK